MNKKGKLFFGKAVLFFSPPFCVVFLTEVLMDLHSFFLHGRFRFFFLEEKLCTFGKKEVERRIGLQKTVKKRCFLIK